MKAAPSPNEAQRPETARSDAVGKGSPEYTAQAAFMVAILALTLVGFLSIRSLLQLGEQSSLVEHSYQVIGQAERMLANMVDVQSGQRGYIITGSEEYLASYDTARVAVQQDVQRLRSLTADNPVQRDYLDELEKLVALRLAIAHERIELRRTHSFKAAQAAVVAGEGKAVTDQIRVAHKNIVAEERRLLAERNQLEQHRIQATLMSIVSLGGLAIVILGLAGVRIRRITAEQRLAAHERDRLFTYALDMYCIAGFDGYFKQLNPAWEKTLGWSKAELLAKPYIEFVHPDDRESTIHAAGTQVDGKEAYKFENRYLCKDGSYKWVSWVSHPEMEEGLIFAVARDITESKRGEARLRQLSRAVEQSPVSIVIANLAADIEYVNPKFTEVTGYTPAEVLGKNPRMWKSGDKSPEEYRELWQTITAGKVWRGEFHNRKKNGELFWQSASISPILDAAGSVTHYVAIEEDITERKRTDELLRDAHEVLETKVRERTAELLTLNETLRHEVLLRQQAAEELRDSEQRMRLATEATEVGIWEWNVLTNRILWDPQMFSIYGIPATADGFVEYSQWSTAVCPEELSQQEQILQDTVRRCGHSTREFRIRRPGEVGYRLIRAVETVRTNAQGQTEWVVGTNQDITERRQNEVALQRAHDELEDKVIQRTAQLNAKNEELKGFTYTVSHDLKAPLRGISGYAQELERRHKEGLPERAQFCIAQIITASRNLDNLIEDLLKYSRLDTETPTVTEVDLSGLLQSILRDRSLVIGEQGVELSVDVPPLTLHIWERGLYQVLTNLIDNAIKYSRQSKPPRLTISAEEINGHCRITVADNGIGFDMKYHDRIYGLFNRLVRPDEFEGTGVGLAIVKKLMEKLGGSIRAESAPGEGATFFVELPK